MLPSSFLSGLFSGYTATPVSDGASGAEVFVLSANEGEFILKQQKASTPFHSLQHEMENYRWLKDKIAVPEVKAFHADVRMEYLCMSRLPGSTLDSLLDVLPRDLWVTLFAETLKQLHAIPLDGTAPSRSLDAYVDAARDNLRRGIVNREDLQEGNRQYSTTQLFEKLLVLKPSHIDPVFIHGDYTPENILFNGEHLSGLIDMGRGGVGDRYHDLALAFRYLKDERSEDDLALFKRVYGLDAADQQRLAFYELLDEFF